MAANILGSPWAVFGKGGAEAGFDSNGPNPTEISLETADSVDDIKCLMSDGSSWFIQAKRACGADSHLESTLAQWCAQTLGPGDRLGLAVRAPTGAVRESGAALDKRRRGSRLLASEGWALTAVTDRLPLDCGEAFENDVLSAAYVLVVQVEQERDTHAVAAANWLAGRLVPDQDGARAFMALRSHFQLAAAEAGTSDINAWMTALDQAGLTLYPNAGGPLAARRQALRTAVVRCRKACFGRYFCADATWRPGTGVRPAPARESSDRDSYPGDSTRPGTGRVGPNQVGSDVSSLQFDDLRQDS
ncbi:hypothetical protein ABIB51_000209 [Arthrobacter sp. UYCu712]